MLTACKRITSDETPPGSPSGVSSLLRKRGTYSVLLKHMLRVIRPVKIRDSIKMETAMLDVLARS
jgi:hypothetical protein